MSPDGYREAGKTPNSDKKDIMRRSVAIVGSGVSGLSAAYALRATHDVTLFEADNRFGGHAHTHSITGTDGRTRRIDSGFIVHNERTYPNLLRIFRELGIQTQATEMSMSINCSGCGLQYAGGRGFKGIAAQPHRLLAPKFVRLLTEVPAFHRAARQLLDGELDADLTWSGFLAQGGYSDYFIQHFAIPLVSCVWSSGDADSGAYPAKHLFEFLNHHGMLTIGNSPTWRTVVGGSQQYVQAIIDQLPNARSNARVVGITRHADHVEVRTPSGTERFDHVILATHADVASSILQDATSDELRDLQSIRYSTNHTWLHTDDALLPTARGARASWNYRKEHCDDSASSVQVSYWMNRLMHLDGDANYVVTLNAEGHVRDDRVIAKMVYDHPVFTTDAVAAAARLREAGGPRLAFAGAHLGWGFHEDGARSGVEAAKKFGAAW